MRRWTTICAILSVAAGWGRSPNLILILADDLGYGDLGCYGQTAYRTPNLDRMSREGARMTDFLVASPGCSPSRAAFLTGCQPVRIGIPHVLNPDSPTGLALEETTLPELLKEQGYATGMFGKWHLGMGRLLPPAHGFDEWYGIPYSNDMWPPNGGSWPTLTWFEGMVRGEAIRTLADQAQITKRLTERSVAFIEKNRDRPFFLYLPHPMPHVPIAASDPFLGRSGAGLYGDMIQELDWSVGEIFKTLKREGIDRETLVVFTSDNGPWLPYGNHSGSAGRLREGKGTTFEGGVRVPMIARWPGRIPAGRRIDALTTALDVLPTFAKLASARLPEKSIDGFDAWGLWSGETGVSPYRAFPYYIWPGNLEAIRVGRWKLHFPHAHRHQSGPAGKDGGRSGEVMSRIELSLYDLTSDVGERDNLADDHPNVVRRLMTVADGVRRELGDVSMGLKGTGQRNPGRVLEP